MSARPPQRDAEVAALRLALGRALVAAGRDDEARDELELARAEASGGAPLAEACAELATLCQRRDPKRALDLLAEAASADPSSAAGPLEAMLEIVCERPSLATARVDEAIAAVASAEPSSRVALAAANLRGQRSLARRDSADARTAFTQALAIDERSPVALAGLVAACQADGDDDAALVYARRGVASLATGADAPEVVALRMIDVLVARGAYRDVAAALAPMAERGGPRVREQLAAALVATGECALALSHLDALRQLSPWALALRALAVCGQGDAPSAVADARAAVAAAPSSVDVLLVLTQVLAETGGWVEAREGMQLLESVPLAPGQVGTGITIARAARTTDADLAFVHAELLHRAGAEPGQVRAVLDVAEAGGVADRAVAPFASRLSGRLLRAAGADGDASDALRRSGEKLRDWSDYDGSLAPLTEALEAAPGDHRPAWLLADSRLMIAWRTYPADAAAVREAIELWDRHLPDDAPTAPHRWVHLTRAHLASLATQQPEPGWRGYWRALVHFEVALALEPLRTDCWSRLLECANNADYYEIGLDDRPGSFVRDPVDAGAQSERAAMLVNAGRFADALAAAAQYRETVGDENDVYLRKIEAVSMLGLDRLAEGAAAMEMLAEVAPDDEWVRSQLGRLRERLGREDADDAHRAVLSLPLDVADRRLRVGRAALALGDGRRALELVRSVGPDEGRDLRVAALAAAGLADEALSELERWRTVNPYPHQGRELLDVELMWARRAARDDAARGAVDRIADVLRRQVDSTRSYGLPEELARLRTATGVDAHWAHLLAELVALRRALVEPAPAVLDHQGAIVRRVAAGLPAPATTIAEHAITGWSDALGSLAERVVSAGSSS